MIVAYKRMSANEISWRFNNKKIQSALLIEQMYEHQHSMNQCGKQLDNTEHQLICQWLPWTIAGQQTQNNFNITVNSTLDNKNDPVNTQNINSKTLKTITAVHWIKLTTKFTQQKHQTGYSKKTQNTA